MGFKQWIDELVHENSLTADDKIVGLALVLLLGEQNSGAIDDDVLIETVQFLSNYYDWAQTATSDDDARVMVEAFGENTARLRAKNAAAVA